MRRIKLTLFLKNGKTIIIKCESAKFSKWTDTTRNLQINNPDKEWAVDLNEVVAITSKKVFF